MTVLRGVPLGGTALAGSSLRGGILGAAVDVPEVTWRFAPASWLNDHRALLDGTYGSSYHAAYVLVGEADYLYFLHDDGTGTYVGHDPGTTVPELAGLDGHVVELPAGNSPAEDVAALAVPVLEAITGIVEAVDNEDGTVTIRGVETASTGATFADRSGGGVMGVRVAEILAGDGGTGALDNLYLSRLVVPSTPGTGPRLPRVLRIWVHSVNVGDAPRVALYRGNGTAPTTLYLDFGQLDVASIAAPGWTDLHIPPSWDETFDGGDDCYLAIKSTANLTQFRFMGSGSGLVGDWDGTFALGFTDGSMSGDAAVPFEASWSGAVSGPVAVIWPAQIVWADLTEPVGDASLVLEWGTHRSTPLAAMLNVTSLPFSIVHMVAPSPNVLGMRLGAGHIGLGAHTTTGTMHVEAWAGDASLLDATPPHNPLSDGLVAVHDYGAEASLSPAAWYDFDAPEEPVYIDAGIALAVSMHSDGVALTEIRFELTGSGLASTLNDRTLAFDWYPSDGSGPGAGSEVEAYSASTPQPPRVNDGNLTVVTDPALPATTPHQQDADDVYQGNVPALGLTLHVDGMGLAAA